MFLSCFLVPLDLPDKTLGDREHRHDGEDLVAAVILAAGDQHLGQLGVQGELGHDGAQLGEVPVIIQRRQVIQQLQRSHQGLQRRSTVCIVIKYTVCDSEGDHCMLGLISI